MLCGMVDRIFLTVLIPSCIASDLQAVLHAAELCFENSDEWPGCRRKRQDPEAVSLLQSNLQIEKIQISNQVPSSTISIHDAGHSEALELTLPFSNTQRLQDDANNSVSFATLSPDPSQSHRLTSALSRHEKVANATLVLDSVAGFSSEVPTYDDVIRNRKKIFDWVLYPRLSFGNRSVHVMGHFNTGTNLLTELMKKNFPNTYIREGSAFDRFFAGRNLWGGSCDFWKHTSLSLLKDQHHHTLDACSTLHIDGVAMIRNPLAWISSMRRKPYDLSACVTGDDWLTRPCSYPTCTGALCMHRDLSMLSGVEYSSLEAIWNSWTQDYEKVDEFGFERGLFVRYEDLIIDAEKELSTIADVLGADMLTEFQLVDEPVSPHTYAENATAAAIKKLQTKSYLQDFTEQELQEACSRLDQDLMLRHGYDDCQQL